MDFKNEKAIYLQIADHICEAIMRKEMNAGEKIPSIREMAMNLEVNPNTVTRTYAYLEEQGIVSIQRGVGYFVASEALPIILTLKKQAFFNEDLPALFRMMELLGIEMKDVVAIYTKRGN